MFLKVFPVVCDIIRLPTHPTSILEDWEGAVFAAMAG